MSAEADFRKQMAEQAKRMEALQAIERELKVDEHKFQATLAGLRSKLEVHTRALSSANSTKARLVKELAACEKEIKQNETGKAEVTAQIHSVTEKAAAQRDEKLRKISGAPAPPPKAAAAAPAAPPPPAGADLLGGDLFGGPVAAAAAAPPPPDFFGGDLMGAAPPPPAAAAGGAMDLLAELGGALPAAPPAAMGGMGMQQQSPQPMMGGMPGQMGGGMCGGMGAGGMGMGGGMVGGAMCMGGVGGGGMPMGGAMPQPSNDDFAGFDGFDAPPAGMTGGQQSSAADPFAGLMG